MSSAIDKYARLIDLLWDKTYKNIIPWEYDQNRNVVRLWGDTLLEMTVEQNENYDNVYAVSIYNNSGQVLEYFNDEHLNEIQINEGFRNYYDKMEKLFDLARRRATGADKALDDFIIRLEKDAFDTPF